MRLVPIFLLAASVLTGAAWLLQLQSSRVLREQIGLLRTENAELARLREENRKLQAAQPSDAELTRLRADHAALVRLRAELNTFRDSIRAQQRAVSAPLSRSAGN